MEEITIKDIEWQAPEYSHRKRSADFFWSIGLITILATILTVWFKDYLFAIFIFIAGGSLIMFTLREPENMSFSIKTEGLTIGKDKYEWKEIRGFNIKNNKLYSKLLIETSKYFLPVYTIPISSSIIGEINDSLSKFVPKKPEIEESHSMMFAEKLGF